MPRVLEYLERGEALVEGRRHGEIAGVHHVLDRGGEGGIERLSTVDLRAGTEAPCGLLAIMETPHASLVCSFSWAGHRGPS